MLLKAGGLQPPGLAHAQPGEFKCVRQSLPAASSAGQTATAPGKWTYRELHPDFRLATPASSYWTISPFLTLAVWMAGVFSSGSDGRIRTFNTRFNRPLPYHLATSEEADAARWQRHKSVLRESNPPIQGGNLAPMPIGQEHVSKGSAKIRARKNPLPSDTGFQPNSFTSKCQNAAP